MTKGALAQRRQQLATYDRALPSLELKRQQLLIELSAERKAVSRLREQSDTLRQRAREIRFAADRDIQLEHLLAISNVTYGSQARFGIELPTFDRIDWAEESPTAEFPPWVDAALQITRSLAETALRIEVVEARCEAIDRALRKAIQRINLLQRVLMPQAREDIVRISTFLADGQRMAISRTKLLVARRAMRAHVP